MLLLSILMILLNFIKIGLTLPVKYSYESTAEYWKKMGKDSIEETIKVFGSIPKSKNVILFIGDGMGISTLTSSRILKGQLLNKNGEEFYLNFESFPHIALIKTYNIDEQIPDSAGTATAIVTGVKTNFGVLGVDGKINQHNTNCDEMEKSSLPTIMEWGQEVGKSTGVLTTTRITHATPASTYAKTANRNWEHDMSIKKSLTKGNCKDIALQLVDSSPGDKLNVIMGGGRKYFLHSNNTDPYTKKKGLRSDKDLIETWLSKHADFKAKYIFNREQLMQIDYDNIDYLLGLFSYDHMEYDLIRKEKNIAEPTLEEMTESAIKILSKNPLGFVLLIEGGRIDHAHHINSAILSLHDVLAFERAIDKALSLVSLEETLIIVTADHSHSLTINGYTPRGNDIFGMNNNEDNVSYDTLMYATGPGHNNHQKNILDRKSDYIHYSSIQLNISTHAGEDVALYSIGPSSKLFHGLQEQSYIGNAIAYALCIGHYNDEKCILQSSAGRINYHINFPLLILFLITIIYII